HSYSHLRHLHSFPTRRSSDLSSPEDESLRDGNDVETTRSELRRFAVMGYSLLRIRFQQVVRRQREELGALRGGTGPDEEVASLADRKSTRLNSSHLGISYAVF